MAHQDLEFLGNEYARLSKIADNKRADMLDGKISKRAWYMAGKKAEKAFMAWFSADCAQRRKGLRR